MAINTGGSKPEDSGSGNVETQIKKKRIFTSNIVLSLICLSFLPFTFDEIWLLQMAIIYAIAGFLFSIFFLKMNKLTAAAVTHLLFTAYLMIFLHLFISDSYNDTLTFICVSFILIADSLLVSTHIRQLYFWTGCVLLSQIIAPYININQKLQISAESQIENMVIFTTFFIVTLLVKKDNERLLSITKSKSDESERNRKKYYQLFESSMDAIILLDANNLRHLEGNKAALELFGILEKDKFLTLRPFDLSPKYQLDGSLSKQKAVLMVKTVLRKGSHFFEWRHSRVDGEEFDSNVLLTRIELGSKKVILATVRNISEQKRTQELLIQSEKMMSVGGLAAGMAHEINNPLAGVLQNAGLLENRLMNKTLPANIKAAESIGTSMENIYGFLDSRSIPRMINAIKDSGTRMASIVDNMLNFARKSDSSFSSHEPATIMEQVLAIASTDYDLKKRFDFKSIIIEKDYSEDLPLVPCNGSEIQQVILNILSNGAHAMFEKLETENGYKPKFLLKLSIENESSMLLIEIEDNGPGMDDKTCKRIFEPFFTTKPAGVGTGLGLSVSYFIITENHNGKIEVQSELGKGAKFIVRLPVEGKKGKT